MISGTQESSADETTNLELFCCWPVSTVSIQQLGDHRQAQVLTQLQHLMPVQALVNSYTVCM